MRKIHDRDISLISIVVGFLAAIMILFPVLILKDSETSFTGLEVAFGHEFASLGSWASGQIEFNPTVLLAFILPLVGSIILMFSNKAHFIATILFIVAAVLIFMIPQFTAVSVTILGNVNSIDVEWTYGIGLIFAASLSILGGLLGLFRLYNSK
ncbi:MAG: hypothetical protein KKH01_00240 [Firmicutes bacterium]|nr:hypothetical protein [Bacillota bacterium]